MKWLINSMVLHAVGSAIANGEIVTLDYNKGRPYLSHIATLPGTGCVIPYYGEDGFITKGLGPISPGRGLRLRGPGGSATPNNGTAYITVGDTESYEVYPDGGGTFRVSSVDLAEYSTVLARPMEIEFTGTRPDAPLVRTRFTIDGRIGKGKGTNDFETFRFPPEFRGLTNLRAECGGFSLDNLVAEIEPEHPAGVLATSSASAEKEASVAADTPEADTSVAPDIAQDANIPAPSGETPPVYPSLADCARPGDLNWRTLARRCNPEDPWSGGLGLIFRWAGVADHKTLREALASPSHDENRVTARDERGDSLLHCVLDPRRHPDKVRTPGSDADLLRTVGLLLDLGADANLANNRRETPLQLAVLDGNEAIIRKLLDSGAAVNGTYNPNEHPVQLAVARGDIAITGLLLDKGANINPDNFEVDYGDEPLALAVRRADIKMTRYLLEKSADRGISASGALGNLLEPLAQRPLPSPVPDNRKREASDRLAIARMLLKAGADPNCVHEAAAGNHTDMVNLLLDAGGEPYPRGEDLTNPPPCALDDAAAFGNLELVRRLLAKRIDGTAVRRAIHCAIRTEYEPGDASSRRVEIVRALLKAGADPRSPDNRQWTPLHHAVATGNLAMVKLLLERGAEANAADMDDIRPLHLDGYPNSTAIAKLLIEHGADPNAAHRNLGYSPIHRAASRGDVELLAYLLEIGVRPDVPAKGFSWQPIHYAVDAGQVGMVKYLLEHGAKVDAGTFTGQTPLHLAASSGWVKMLRFLLEQGADPNAKNSRGQTPLDFARNRNQAPCVEILERFGTKPLPSVEGPPQE